MPHKVENTPLDWNKIPEDEGKHVPLTSSWILASNDETVTLIITCLKWTFIHAFWIRVTVHPERNSLIWTQLDTDAHHPLLRSLSDAFNLYAIFPEIHLNSYLFKPRSWKSKQNVWVSSLSETLWLRLS